jgi:hypothetical protein
LHWLIEAAEHLRAFSAYFLCDLHVKQLQLDELYAVLSAVKGGARLVRSRRSNAYRVPRTGYGWRSTP